MTVSELIEWLKSQDPDATVEVVNHTSGRGHYDQGGNATTVDFNPAEHAHYEDLRGNPLITSDKPYFERRTLLLGNHDA